MMKNPIFVSVFWLLEYVYKSCLNFRVQYIPLGFHQTFRFQRLHEYYQFPKLSVLNLVLPLMNGILGQNSPHIQYKQLLIT